MAHKNKTNWSPYKARQITFRKKSEAAAEARKAAGTTDPQKPEEKKSSHKKPDKIYGLEEANDRLYDIFKNHEFENFTHERRHQLAQYYVLLMEEQMENNFTRLVNIRDIAIRHFIDSLIVTKHTQFKFPLMDIGTGPGFPGIPLKIYYPDKPIILAEGVGKRCDFLRRVKEELGLKNLEIIQKNIRLSTTEPKVKSVITRAVEDISNTLRNAHNVLEMKGRVYFMKGPNVDPEIEMAQKLSSAYKLVEDIAYDLPKTTHKRRLIIYEKIGELK